MANGEPTSLLPKPAGAVKRPRYKPGSYLSAKDLLTEQRYRLQRLWQHNRYLHGSGVLCGLQVVPAQELGRPWAVRVCPGYAIGCCGEEMEVRSPAVVDVRNYLWNRPAEHGRASPFAYIVIRYTEQLVKPVPQTLPACSCDDTMYEHSRIIDSYKFDVLWVLKGTFAKGFDICFRHLARCPDVLLAAVTLPASESDPITSAHIDNRSHRRQIAMTAILQAQLAQCCCKESDTGGN